MAPLTPSLRPSLLIIILVWFIHRTHTFTIKPISSPSTYRMRFHNAFPHSFHRTAANNMDSRKETPFSDFQGRKSPRTRNNPSDYVLNYLHNLLHGRTPKDAIYNQIGKDLRQRLQVIVQEIADMLRSNSKQYKQRQRKNKKGGGYTVETSSDFVYYDDGFPNSFGIGTDDRDTGIYNRETPSAHIPFPSQQIPSMGPVSRTPAAFEPISEPPDIFRYPPTEPWSELPPSDVTVTFKANQFEEIYHIAPSPRYKILDLFRDLVSRRNHPLSASLNRTDSCTYIENVDNLGRIDAVFEWRIVIFNSQTEEIWNSQCLPPDTVTLKFGYEVIITLQQRPGVREDFILLSQELEEEYDEALEDLL